MRKKTAYLTLFCLLLMIVSPLAFTKESSALNSVQTAKTEKFYKSTKGIQKKIDGTTSASKLRAKKSHSVSKQDETKLTVFLGLFAIAIIVFFLRAMTDKK